jgi:protein TonB
MSKLSKINIFDSSWVDLIFAGRNQNYGAYVLRKKSNENTNKGIFFAIVFFSLVISAPMIVDLIKGLAPKEEVNKKVTEANTLEEPPPVDEKTPPPPPAPPPPPLKSTVKFTPPEIKPDEEVPDEPPPIQDKLTTTTVSNQTQVGNDSIFVPIEDDETGGDGPEIVTFAEQMPEFGDGTYQEFLANHMSYPEMAKANGQTGKVILSFVVGRDGKLSEITVIKDPGWGFGEAAVEAVRKMPPWKPAKQNGKPVPLRMTLPVNFSLDN